MLVLFQPQGWREVMGQISKSHFHRLELFINWVGIENQVRY